MSGMEEMVISDFRSTLSNRESESGADFVRPERVERVTSVPQVSE